MRARIINKSSIEVVDIEAKILKINMIYKSKLASNGVDDDAISKLLGVEERCLSDKNKALLKKRKETRIDTHETTTFNDREDLGFDKEPAHDIDGNPEKKS